MLYCSLDALLPVQFLEKHDEAFDRSRQIRKSTRQKRTRAVILAAQTATEHLEGWWSENALSTTYPPRDAHARARQCWMESRAQLPKSAIVCRAARCLADGLPTQDAHHARSSYARALSANHNLKEVTTELDMVRVMMVMVFMKLDRRCDHCLFNSFLLRLPEAASDTDRQLWVVHTYSAYLKTKNVTKFSAKCTRYTTRLSTQNNGSRTWKMATTPRMIFRTT